MKIRTNMIKMRFCQASCSGQRVYNPITKTQTADRMVHAALWGLEGNQALILVPARARLTALVYRIAPGFVHTIGRHVDAAELRNRPKGSV
jgi:hypothetical protein